MCQLTLNGAFALLCEVRTEDLRREKIGTGQSGRSLRAFDAEGKYLLLGPDKPVPIFSRCPETGDLNIRFSKILRLGLDCFLSRPVSAPALRRCDLLCEGFGWLCC